jgi:flagellin-specific chaperone FliS
MKNQSSKYSKEFLNKTIKVWQPYASTPLSLDDAREISQNMISLFDFLIAEEKKSQDKSVIHNNNCFKNKTGKEV